VFLEVTGVQYHSKIPIKDEKGNIKEWKELNTPIFKQHPRLFAIIFVIIAIMVFIGSGGLQLLGWQFNLNSQQVMTIMFFVVILMAIAWMIGEKEEK
jgi:tryptophan-rich sensory protein